MTNAQLQPLTRPRRLTAGDRVAIIAPSGPVVRDRLETGLAILRTWGLDPVVMPHVLDHHSRLAFLAGDDAARASDFQNAWCDPEIAAVVCARGGYGAQRILDRIDWAALVAAGPNLLVGYSDITAIHEAIAFHLGVASLHGPMSATEVFVSDRASQEHLRATLFEPEQVQSITSSTARTLVSGVAHGVTVGGCVALLAAGIGTPDAGRGVPGGIVLLEDVGVEPYQLDRALTQLVRAGWFDRVAGIALGSWRDCGDYDDIRAVVLDRLGDLGVPIIEELGFGHAGGAMTMPLGVAATLDADACTLTLDVPALASF